MDAWNGTNLEYLLWMGNGLEQGGIPKYPIWTTRTIQRARVHVSMYALYALHPLAYVQ